MPPGLKAPPGVYVDVNPRWSHDGRQIAFLRATPDRNLQLYVTGGALARPLALLEAELLCPDRPYSSSLQSYASPDTLAWSPDDAQIAFARIEWFTFEGGERLPGTGLWALKLSTGRVTPLALHPARYLSGFYYYHTPQWSPDGRYLAFVGEGINGQRALFLRPLRAQKAQDVNPLFDNFEDSDWLAWEPLVFAHSGHPALVYRRGIRRTFSIAPTETLRRLLPGDAADQATGEMWRLTARDYARLLPLTRESEGAVTPRTAHLVWSPDGRWLAFTLTPDANNFTRYELWIVKEDGTGARRVSPADGRGYFAPVWIDAGHLGALSPRGKRFDVMTVDIRTRKTRALGTIESADCDWSPDRSRIIYAGPPTDAQPDSSRPTTLRLFKTGIRRR